MRTITLVPVPFATAPAGVVFAGFTAVGDAGVVLAGGLGGVALQAVGAPTDLGGEISLFFNDDGTIPAAATIVSVQLAITHQILGGGAVDLVSFGFGMRLISHGTDNLIGYTDLPTIDPVSLPATWTTLHSAELVVNPCTGAPWTRADLFASGPFGLFANGGLWAFTMLLKSGTPNPTYGIDAIALLVKYIVPAPRLREDDLVQLQKTVNAVATGTLTTNAPGTPVGSSLRLGLQPSTCALNGLIDDAAFGPGTFDPTAALFAGRVLTTLERYEGKPGQRAFDLTLTDHVYELNKRRPFGTWVNVSVTTIALSLLAEFASAFTGVHVQAGLPAVSIVFDGSQDFTTCLTTLAQLIDADQYIDSQRDLHLPASTTSAPPDDLVLGSPTLLDDPPISWTTDLSQIRTRVYGKDTSAPSKAVSPANPGATSLQVEASTIFDLGSGQVITGSQRLIYGGQGIIAPGLMTVTTRNDLAGGVIGPVSYAVTFVIGGVETEFSASSSSTANTRVGPGNFTHAVGGSGGGIRQYVMTFYTATGETEVLGTTACAPTGAVFTLPVSGDPRVLGVKIYAVDLPWGGPGPAQYGLLATVPIGTTSYTDTGAGIGGAVNYNIPFPENNAGSQNILTLIPLGPTGTTARNIYRTASGGTTALTLPGVSGPPWPATQIGPPTYRPGMLLLATLADNTTETYTDLSASYGIVGATVPSPPGILLLTGIPSSGVGSITSPIAAGDVLNLWGQRDDVPAQVALGQLELDDDGNPTDGIHEYTIPPGAYPTAALLNQRLDAELVLFSRPLVAVTFDSLDPKIQVGVSIHGDINPTFGGGWFNPAFFGAWFDPVTVTSGLYGDFLIQTDTISQVAIAAHTAPRHHVVASSTRFTLNDLLRRVLVMG